MVNGGLIWGTECVLGKLIGVTRIVGARSEVGAKRGQERGSVCACVHLGVLVVCGAGRGGAGRVLCMPMSGSVCW